MPFQLSLTSTRLYIRELRPDDAPFIVRLLNEPTFLANIGDKNVRSIPDAERYILEAGLNNYNSFGFGMFLIEEKESAQPVGIGGFLKRDFLPHPDIGFAFLPLFHGKGLGTEFAKSMINWAVQTLRVQKLSAFTAVSNTASIRVLEKNGFYSLGEHILPGRTESTHVLEWTHSSVNKPS